MMTKVLIDSDVKLGKNTLLEKHIDIDLLSGWQTNTSFAKPHVIKVIDFVMLFGFVTGGAANSNIGLLPEEFRPKSTHRFKTASAGADTLIQVQTSGIISVLGSNTTNIFLDGIIFKTS